MAGKNIDLRMQKNRNRILDIIRMNPDISRSGIKELSGLSMETVLKTVDKLLNDGLIYESGSSAGQVGRKATWLTIHPSGQHFIGLKFNRSMLCGVLLNFKGDIIKYIDRAFPVPVTAENVSKTLVDVAKEFIEFLGSDKKRICGIGIGAPGVVDSQKGIIKSYAGIQDIHHLEIKKILETETGIPTLVDSGMRVTALSHKMSKENANITNLLYFIIKSGVGMASIVDNKILAGSSSSAGEIGHVQVVTENPRRCQCGRLGCLESEIAHAAIVEKMRDGLSQGKFQYLKHKAPHITVRDLNIGVALNEPDAIDLLRHICALLSKVVVDAAAVVNPGKIIFIGEITVIPEFQEYMKDAVLQRCPPDIASAVTIKGYDFDDKLTAAGAAFLVMSHEFGIWGDAFKQSE